MNLRRLLADCGNTTIKLATADGPLVGAITRLGADPTALAAWFASHAARAGELVVAPGAAATTAALLASAPAGLPRRILGTDQAVPDLGQYPGCGVDRVLAGLAAGVLAREPVIVVDCGTATTLGAWWVAAPRVDHQPFAALRFLGGVILPSARACSLGLHTLAPVLPVVEAGQPDHRADQHDTRRALEAGLGIGYGPMVAACLVKLRRETGANAVLVTGGAADFLVRSRIVTADRVVEDLVLRGLAQLAEMPHG
jgi:type III pantothenate kinase